MRNPASAYLCKEKTMINSETILAQLQISKEHRINEVSLLLGKKNNLPNTAWKPNILVANFFKASLTLLISRFPTTA
jgi:hypothetical protein